MEFDSIKIEYIAVEANLGEAINTALREATLLALTEKRDVLLSFNKQVFRVSPFEIIDFLIQKAEAVK